MLTVKERINLLAKVVWTYNDISEYMDIGSTTAIKIKNKALSEGYGTDVGGTLYVKIDGVLKQFGTSVERETAKLKALSVADELHKEDI